MSQPLRKSRATNVRRLTDTQMRTHELWQELRDHIEIELTTIDRAIRNDPDQIGNSADAVYSSAERLKELVPELKQIAKGLEDREWQETLEGLPR